MLLQAGKGGGMGIAFGGGGGSQTVFGSSGAGNFLTRLTSITAFFFLLTSLALAHYSSQQDSRRLQRLAEQKAVQKKDEDARSAKLKMELDKARQNIQKTAGATAPAAGDRREAGARRRPRPRPRRRPRPRPKPRRRTADKAEGHEGGGREACGLRCDDRAGGAAAQEDAGGCPGRGSTDTTAPAEKPAAKEPEGQSAPAAP